MKRFLKGLLFLILSVLCFYTLTACGGSGSPTPTYTAFHDYLESRGGEQKFEDLKDSKLGNVDVTFQAMKSSIYVSAFYTDKSTYYHVSYFFDCDQTRPVSVYYTESSRTSDLEIKVNGESTDLSSADVFTVKKVERELNGEEKELPASDPLYSAAVSTAKNAVRSTLSWITAELQVALDDDTVTVQDLYSQS